MDIDEKYVRTLGDVNSVVKHAKLSRSDLKGTSQVLYFADEFPEYKFLEVDVNLAQHLENGGELYMRGRPNDRVVVCTADQTFDLKSAETSNSLLLVPNLKMNDEIDNVTGENGEIEEKRIVGVYGEYFELKKIKPQLGRLRNLLSEKLYNGPENESGDGKTYTFDDLTEQVQASETEIRAALDQIQAVEMEGCWRLLDHEYEFRALSILLNFVEGNSWEPDKVPIRETTSELEGLLPDAILDYVLRVYLEPTDEFTEDCDKFYRLNEFKICRFLGESVLRTVDKYNLNDFKKLWAASVPAGLTTNLAMLAGVALHDDNTKPPVIWYFPERLLPEDPAERFGRLFAERASWRLYDITPYVAPLATDKQPVTALLAKYARSSTAGGQKTYSARHGK